VVKLKIGIIFGGCSEEHPVSVKSAQEVAKHLDLDKYEPLWIGITTAALGSSVTAQARTGKATAAVRSCCHRTEASTGCSFWIGNGTR